MSPAIGDSRSATFRTTRSALVTTWVVTSADRPAGFWVGVGEVRVALLVSSVPGSVSPGTNAEIVTVCDAPTARSPKAQDTALPSPESVQVTPSAAEIPSGSTSTPVGSSSDSTTAEAFDGPVLTAVRV